jgi:oligopeptide transport system ATP-binding protein
MRRIRGDRIAMIFQEPMTSLNPSLTIGLQIAEPIVHQHERLARGKRRWTGARPARGRCGIPDAAELSAAHLAAPLLRRHAPARDDRDGARLPARS